jgi:hypothetical protein
MIQVKKMLVVCTMVVMWGGEKERALSELQIPEQMSTLGLTLRRSWTNE